jgi:hypothetical protein
MFLGKNHSVRLNSIYIYLMINSFQHYYYLNACELFFSISKSLSFKTWYDQGSFEANIFPLFDRIKTKTS